MKKKVLIIEDQEHIANAEKLILETVYSVKVARDGQSGLEIARSFDPDAIVLDLMLPKRGGYDVCFHLRQDEKMKKIKILMVTAKNETVDQQKGMLVGADDYLTKPFEPSELLSRVNKLLSQ